MPPCRTTPLVDYADPRFWSLAPGAAGTAAAYFGQPGTPAVDVFYVHPTTYHGPDENQQIGDTAADDWTDRSAIIRHLAPFAGLCRLFAPRYAQAGVRAVRAPAGAAAYDRAYGDVVQAFSHYLRQHRCGRRFFLVGHSQGALHAGRLLREVIEAEQIQDAMIAAYLPGIGISAGLFGPYYRRVQPGTAPSQTGCVLSWNSFLAGADTAAFRARAQARDEARLGGAAAGPTICINPLSFDAARPAVAAAANPGSLVGAAGTLPLPPLQPGLAGARVREGILQISPAPASAWGLAALPGGNMHMHDLALFQAALAANARQRAAAALAGDAPAG
jgi:hypothetical protein